MTETLLQKLEEEDLKCPICLDIYEEPKLLQCFHVYCQQCIRRVPKDQKEGEVLLPCPECRQETPLPGGKVANLKSAFHINRLLEVRKQLKEREDGSASAENSPGGNSAPASSIKPHCSLHTDQELTLYCEECGKVICLKCAVKGLGNHFAHKTMPLEAAFNKYKEEISSSIAILEGQHESVAEALKKIEECSGEVKKQQETIEADIHGHLQDTRESQPITQLRHLQDVRESQLITQLRRIAADKLQSLAAQEKQLKSIKAQIKSCLSFMKENMKMDTYHDVLEMKTSAVQQIRRLIASFRSELLSPCTEADLLYSESAKVFTTGREDSKCAATLFIKVHALEGDSDIVVQQSLMSITEAAFACPANSETRSYSSAILRLPVGFYYNALTGIALLGDLVRQRTYPGSVLPHVNTLVTSQIVRRPMHDIFRPPHGHPVEYLTSVGYGREIRLSDGVQEVYDPCAKKSFFLDHKKFKIIMTNLRPKPERQVTVPPAYIMAGCVVDSNMPSNLCAQASVVKEISARARSKPVGFTLSMRGQDGSPGMNGQEGAHGGNGRDGMSGDTGLLGFRAKRGGHHGGDGGSGSPGTRGGCGNNGQRGGDAFLILTGSPDNLQVIGSRDFGVNLGGTKSEQILLVDCHGGDGGRGGLGGKGGRGGAGGNGGRGARGYNGDVSGQNGGDGGDGGNGGDGGEGGRGGDAGDGGDAGGGGNCLIQTYDARLLMLVEADLMQGEPGAGVKGGAGGPGGVPGRGGIGGNGGKAGPPATTTTSDNRTVVTKHTYPGYPGRDGRSGNNGRTGESGKDSKCGRKAQNGGILWMVLCNKTGNKVQESSTRYDIKVKSFKVSPALSDGIFEPNERVIVSGMLIHNIGGLDLPYGATAFIPSTATINFEPARFNIPHNAMKTGKKYTIPFEFYGRIADLAPPNKPGPQNFTAEFHPRIELLGRPFEKSFLSRKLDVKYPIQLGNLYCPQDMDRGEVGLISIEVTNLSNRPYGNCPGSEGRALLHLHFDSRLIPLSTATSGNAEIPYVVTYDHSTPDSTIVELSEIPPKRTVTVTIEVLMENYAELFDQCLWQADLRLRDKLIEYSHRTIRVTPLYHPHRAPADVLLVTSEEVTRKEFVFWKNVLQLLGVTFDVWDTSRHYGFSVDCRTSTRHQHSWHGRYVGRMILYPHCNLQLLMGIDIPQHFHGSNFREGPLKELNSSFIAFMHDSGSEKSNEIAMLKHLAVVDSNVELPENTYSGKHLSQPNPNKNPPPYANCEKQIFKKLEEKNLSQAHVLLGHHVQITSIKLQPQVGRPRNDIVFYLPDDAIIGMEELVMITLAWEVADEMFSCSGEAHRMREIYNDFKDHPDAYVESGRIILRGLQLIAKEFNKRKSAGLKHFKVMQAYGKIVEISGNIQKILSDAGVSNVKLEPMASLETLQDRGRVHCCHQHFAKEGMWNLVDV